MIDVFVDLLDVALQVLELALQTLRYCDGMKGASLGLLYDLLLQLDRLYQNTIKTLDEKTSLRVDSQFPFS